MFVLEGPTSDQSPLDSKDWKFHGPVGNLPEDQWAIDGTVINLHDELFFVYSGWPLDEKKDESKQEIYIIKMNSPTSTIGRPIRISTPEYPFEYSGRSGINEGPQFLCSPDGRWKGIAYSCAGSWTHEYKMNVLHYVGGGNPLDPGSWVKWKSPLLKASRDDSPPYGPGHGNFVFVNGPGGLQETWGVFHATDRKTGWEGRKARLMRVGWGDQGPYMGTGECGTCCDDVRRFLHGGHAGAANGGGWTVHFD